MTNNLYEILGVERDATPEQIKKAYRTLCKTHHPDVGGDPEEFRKVQEAYDCLMDEDKRKRYDEFGFIPGGEAEKHALIVINTLCRVFDEMSQSLTPEELEKFDLIGIMKDAILEKTTKQYECIDLINKDIQSINKLKSVLEGRLKTRTQKSTPNFFIKTLEKRISNAEIHLKDAEYQLKLSKDMYEMVGEYDFTFDTEEAPQQQRIQLMNGHGDFLGYLLGGRNE